MGVLTCVGTAGAGSVDCGVFRVFFSKLGSSVASTGL